MKKSKEMKIYEVLGIKKFKKFVYGVYFTLYLPFAIIRNKTLKFKILKKDMLDIPNNYNIGKKINLDKIIDFKKMLIINASIHIGVQLLWVPNYIDIINGTMNISSIFENICMFAINTYCIMLQRYNYIRINNIIDKGMPKYIEEKEEYKEKIKDEDSKIYEHEYVFDKSLFDNVKEKKIDFEQLIENSTLEELKICHDKLNYLIENMEGLSFEDESISYPIMYKNNEYLKIKIKNKQR